MAGITQTIPTYVHGISEQPDELKMPGQVRDALNVLPDVTKGLLKRPGARLINPLTTTAGGSWFHIYKGDHDHYIGKVNINGKVEIWSCTDGLPRIVTYQDTPFQMYPKESSDGSTDSSNRPSYLACNTAAFQASMMALRTASAATQAKRIEHAKAVEQRDALSEKLKERKRYLEYEQNGSSYRPITGVVRYEHPFATKGFIDVPINKPLAAVDEVVTQASKPAVTNKMWSVGEQPGSAYGLVRGDLYAWVLRKADPKAAQELKDLEAKVTTLTQEVDTLASTEEAALSEYSKQAKACGITTSPVARIDIAPFAVVNDPPSYLIHADPEELQFLTVNDYTFVVNRTRVATMNPGPPPKGYYEAFIELKNLVYDREYGVNFYTPNAGTVRLTSAKRLAIVDRGALKNDLPTGATCRMTGTQVYTIDRGSKTGLRFEIDVLGVAKLDNETDKYFCKYEHVVVNLLNGGTGWEEDDVVTVTYKGQEIKVKVTSVTRSREHADIGVIRALAPHEPSATVKPSTILNDLIRDIKGLKTPGGVRLFDDADVIKCGNGIYVRSVLPFKAESTDLQVVNVLSESITDVSRLPMQCVDGYVIKVANSAENADDYYLEFQTDDNASKGSGSWVETTKPGIATTINPESMPHQIVYNPNNDEFIVSPVDWEPRLVGDDVTNPKPSFINKTINKMLFYRNRLVMLSDENVILSRAGDYWNFWCKTAMAINPSDPIDISASSTYPALLYDGLEVNAGLLLFSSNEQFLLTTDNDILGPETAKVNSVATYNYNYHTPPIKLGATVGFLNNAGSNSRFFEMTNIRREGEAEVLEQSKLISERFPDNINLVADSRENTLLLFGTRDKRDIWGYRYFNSGEERIQSAWFRWELTGDLVYHCILQDVYFAVLVNTSDATGNTIVTLQRFDLKSGDWTATINDSELYKYTLHLDNYIICLPSQLNYSMIRDKTLFRLPFGYFADKKLAAYVLGPNAIRTGKLQGKAIYPEIEIDRLGTFAVFDGDLSGTRLMLGYEFTMDVELPTIYYQRQEGNKTRSDLRSSLIIHRVKFSLGPVGVYDTTIERKGRPDYTHLYETREQDGYNADSVALAHQVQTTVPCYERNTNLSIHIRSSHPSPATVYSMTWEGDLNKMYYQRV